jgi:GDP-L-fucose synthase
LINSRTLGVKLSGARIIVTGGAGFLGRPVVNQLSAAGATCVVPRSRDYDLETEAGVAQLFADHPADAVVHLAARVGGIGANRENPGYFIYANMVMGALVMEHARRSGVAKYLQVGTVCSYPKHTPVPFVETALWDGYPEETNAPYGVAKRALLVQAQAYRQQYGLNAITLLPVNLYGPGDNFDLESSHVIPALIRKMAEAGDDPEATITLWGDGSPSREFLYVDDCARAITLALERYNSPEPVNLGTGAEVTIRDLAEQIAAATGFAGSVVWDQTRPNGQPRRCLDTSRANDGFGFRPEVSLEEGLRETVSWYRTRQDLAVSS